MSVPLELLWPTDRAGLLVEPDPAEDVLAELYHHGSDAGVGRSWVRANMVATIDGAAVGPDGGTGSINGDADLRVLVLLRALADVVLVGAGTVRAERYRPIRVRPALAERRAEAGQDPTPRLAIVTRTGAVPPELLDHQHASNIVLVTCSAAGKETLRRLQDSAADVLIAGDDEVDFATVIDMLADRGLTRVLTEGGPTLLREVVATGCLDELCLTWSPLLLAGGAPRILHGDLIDTRARLAHLLHHDSTLIGRWLIER